MSWFHSHRGEEKSERDCTFPYISISAVSAVLGIVENYVVSRESERERWKSFCASLPRFLFSVSTVRGLIMVRAGGERHKWKFRSFRMWENVNLATSLYFDNYTTIWWMHASSRNFCHRLKFMSASYAPLLSARSKFESTMEWKFTFGENQRKSFFCVFFYVALGAAVSRHPWRRRRWGKKWCFFCLLLLKQ